MSYIGTSKVGGMYLGDTKIGKAYLGDDLVYSTDDYLSGFMFNKADIGNTSSTVNNVQGYCISPFFPIEHNLSVRFGYKKPQYGLATFTDAGVAKEVFYSSSANTNTVRTFTPSQLRGSGGTKFRVTFLMSDIDNCYILDTTDNVYLWKGKNV